MAISSDDTAVRRLPVLDPRAQFLSELLPLRPELERAARRYNNNFHDAEDLLAETYTKAWAGFASFTRGTNFRAWIYRIMAHAWINGYRRAQARPKETLTDAFSDVHLCANAQRFGGAQSAEESQLQDMFSGPVLSAFRTLSAPQQAAIFYADVCQLPYKTIGEIMGVPLGTVMSRVHRGRGRLREALCQNESRSASPHLTIASGDTTLACQSAR